MKEDLLPSRAMATEDILEVDPASTGLKTRDYLLYCYYGAMVCIGLKHLDRALELLTLALTVPAEGLSAIMVAAYRKYILVSLLKDGAVSLLPKYQPTFLSRAVGPLLLLRSLDEERNRERGAFLQP